MLELGDARRPRDCHIIVISLLLLFCISLFASQHQFLDHIFCLPRILLIIKQQFELSALQTTKHLFFNCDFSCQCVEALEHWLGITWSIKHINDLHRKRRMPKTPWRLIVAIFYNLIYTIWNVRNEAVWQKKVATIQRVVETIKSNSKIRFSSLTLNESTSCWLRNL